VVRGASCGRVESVVKVVKFFRLNFLKKEFAMCLNFFKRVVWLDRFLALLRQ